MATKIMLIIAADNVSGPLKGIFQMIENVNSPDLEIYLYNFQCGDYKKTPLLEIIQEKRILMHFLTQKNKNYISLIRMILSEVKKNEYNIVQTHGFKPTFIVFFARIVSKVKWVCFMHGRTSENLKVRFYNLVDNFLQLAAHRTILVSEAQRHQVFGGNNTYRVHVLHNAVDLEHSTPVLDGTRPVREMLDLARESKIVVTVSRFSPEKGIDILLEALALLARQLDNIHLILVGDGQERHALEKQVEKLGVEKLVHFTGYTNTPGDYVREADLFVLSSRSEGIPNAVLEAMAMGKPVVATAVGGVPEIIEDGVSGLLVHPENPLLLSKAMANVLTDQALSRRLAVEGKRRVQESFSIDARVAKLQALYKEVLSGA